MNTTLNKDDKFPLPYLFCQRVPYKKGIALTKSNIHQTDSYSVGKYHKPICLI